MITKGMISSMYLIPNKPEMGLVVISPDKVGYIVTEIHLPSINAPAYHLGMEVLVDTDRCELIYQ